MPPCRPRLPSSRKSWRAFTAPRTGRRASRPSSTSATPNSKEPELTDTELDGCVAIVTGAAMGIGKACANALARAGAAGVLADIDAAAGEAACAEIVGTGGNAVFVACDVNSLAD